MKDIVPKIFTFGLSFLMFGIAVLQIILGYILFGKTGHQKRIYMSDEPTKFWLIVAIPIVIGILAFILGILSILKKTKS